MRCVCVCVCVCVCRYGRLVLVSGQIGLDPATMAILAPDASAQVIQPYYLIQP